MKRTPTLFAVLALVATLGVTGCNLETNVTPSNTGNSGQNDQQDQQDQGADAPVVNPSAIKLDDPTGEVSLSPNYYFVFDGSGSMMGAPPRSPNGDHKFKTKLEAAQWAVKEFVKNLPQEVEIGGKKYPVNVGLYVFDGYGHREVLGLGKGTRADFIKEIDNVYANTDTPLGKAISKGTDALVAQYKHQLGYGDYRLIVITDGEASDYLQAGVDHANKYAMPICTIGFGVGKEHNLFSSSVTYKSADSAQDIQQGLEEAVSEQEYYDPDTFKASK